MKKPKDIDEYIAGFPKETQLVLEQVRAAVKKAAPQAAEVISYSMPAFKQKGVLVYFAGHEKHIGFYPTSSGIKAFAKEFSAYKWSKGAVQFPLDKPMPLRLIAKMVKFRLAEDMQKGLKK